MLKVRIINSKVSICLVKNYVKFYKENALYIYMYIYISRGFVRSGLFAAQRCARNFCPRFCFEIKLFEEVTIISCNIKIYLKVRFGKRKLSVIKKLH